MGVVSRYQYFYKCSSLGTNDLHSVVFMKIKMVAGIIICPHPYGHVIIPRTYGSFLLHSKGELKLQMELRLVII